MSCVLSPGHGAHCAIRLLLFHAYCVVNQQAKELLFAIVKKRCKVVVARATYFISLKDVSFAFENHEANIADTAGIEPATLSLGGKCSIPLSYVSLSGLAMQLTSPVVGRCRQTKDFKPTLTGNILTLTFNNLQTNHYLLIFSYFLVHPMFLQHIVYVCF